MAAPNRAENILHSVPNSFLAPSRVALFLRFKDASASRLLFHTLVADRMTSSAMPDPVMLAFSRRGGRTLNPKPRERRTEARKC